MEWKQVIAESYNLTSVGEKIWGYYNTRVGKTIKAFIKENDIDTSHFDMQKLNRRWKVIEKECPVCHKMFETRERHPREKTVCSHACSNTYFRSGENHGNWNGGLGLRNYYQNVCFRYHKKKCIICDEDKIVAVHHFDANNKNHEPDNLIPLCPTHHIYYHSRFKDLVEQKIIDYRNKWITAGIPSVL